MDQVTDWAYHVTDWAYHMTDWASGYYCYTGYYTDGDDISDSPYYRESGFPGNRCCYRQAGACCSPDERGAQLWLSMQRFQPPEKLT